LDWELVITFKTLVEAASNPNFTLSVNTSSISVTGKTPTKSLPTAVPSTTVTVNATLLTTNATLLPTNATLPPVNATLLTTNATLLTTNVTLPPVNATLPTANATLPPINVTLPPANATLLPTNATLPLTNATLPAATATLLPTNMTSPSAYVTSPPPSTTPPSEVTSASAAIEPKISLEFKMQQKFTQDLTNTSSPAFQQLEETVTTALNQVYSAKFGSRFNRTIVNSFRQGSVVADVDLIFNNATMSLPNTSSIAQTLVEAASNPNFTLSVNTSSISTPTKSLPTAVPSTTVTEVTSASAAIEPKISLEFKMQQKFTQDLTNTSSPAFQQLEETVTTALNQVYSAKFGSGFNRTIVNSFSQGSVVVNSELIFRNSSSVPDTAAVVSALVEAASNNSNFSIPVNVSTIVATHQTFTSDLSDQTSAAFQTLAATVIKVVRH
uniref:SEA domain-containing protein n=1 Tax=Tetraodon nigroviridis TaxID=99883 RepID=H3C388_TETNG